jgi:hypothetical protein
MSQLKPVTNVLVAVETGPLWSAITLIFIGSRSNLIDTAALLTRKLGVLINVQKTIVVFVFGTSN